MRLIDNERLTVKLYAEPPADVPPDNLVATFHRWIQDDVLPDHLPIDVADYSHVHRGPGVLLACHAGTFAFDDTDGRPGLRYRRRRPAYGEAPLPDALRSLAHAAAALQDEPTLRDRLRLLDDELLLQIDDRLRAPRHDATLAALRDELAGAAPTLFGEAVALEIELVSGQQEPFAARVRAHAGFGVLSGQALPT